MRKIAFIFLLLISSNTFAQRQYIGIRGGIGQTKSLGYVNFTQPGTYTIPYSKSRTVFSGGFTYEHILTKRFSFVSECLYQQQKFEHGILDYYISKEDYDFLGIPIKIQFNFSKGKLLGFSSIGLMPTLLLDARETSTYYDKQNNIVFIEKHNRTSNSSLLNITGLVELGGLYKYDNKFLFVSIALQTSYESYDVISINLRGAGIWHTGKIISFGIKYPLSKK